MMIVAVACKTLTLKKTFAIAKWPVEGQKKETGGGLQDLARITELREQNRGRKFH